MRLLEAVVKLVPPLLLLAAVLFFRSRRNSGPLPPLPPQQVFTDPAPPGWVRVTGQVVALNIWTGWRIRYPLPDGSAREFGVVYTRPSALQKGMAVPVLVDAANPTNARLDHPGHRAVISMQKRFVLVLAIAFLVLSGLVILPIMVLLFRGS